MTHVMIRHKIDDFTAWKKEFDNFADFRRSSGEKSYQVWQHDEDPNNLYLMFTWDNVDNARRFLDSSSLKDAMQRAGVIEAPEIHFLSESDRGKH